MSEDSNDDEQDGRVSIVQMKLPDKLCEAEDGPVFRALLLHPGEVLQVVWALAAGPGDRRVARRGFQPTSVLWKTIQFISI